MVCDSVIGSAEGVKLPDPSEMITLIVGEVTDSAPANCGYRCIRTKS